MFLLKVFIVITALLGSVLADAGYPKETPAKPFNSGSEPTSSDNVIPGSSGGAMDQGWSAGGSYGVPVSMDYVSRYYGPIALPVVLPNGFIADTPSVAAAKAAHLAALDKAKALWFGKGQASYGGSSSPSSGNTPYYGTLSSVMVLPSGYIADTPTIAAARAAHLSALRMAQAAWKPTGWKAWQ